MPPLSTADREAFLAQPHVAALAVEAGPERGPLLVPIWYGYEPGGSDVWIVTPPGSRKAELIRAAGRFSLMVERTQPSYRYVSVEGPVSDVATATDEEVRTLCARYLPPNSPEFEQVRAVYGPDDVIIRMAPQRWLSSDLGAF